MRIWTGLFGCLAIAGAIASPQTASAQDWCGFLDKAKAQVKCGYSSLQECQQALGEKKASDKKSADKNLGAGDNSPVCVPDPANG
jgi:hypothetical protein